MKISASLLSCDVLNIEREINNVQGAGVDYLHIDIMDGMFVPNIAFGIEFVKRISSIAQIPVVVQLMIDNPDKFIDVISHFNVYSLIVHIEGNRDIEKTILRIKSRVNKIGIAINPLTSISKIERLAEMIDIAVIMGVHPGFGGQILVPGTIGKTRDAKNLLGNVLIAVSGGINDKTSGEIIGAGADMIVVGKYLFGSDGTSIKQKVENLRKSYIKAS